MNNDDKYGLNELHSELLDIMSFIHDFCDEQGIKYSLTGGSLLGAIRHNGFIPWDDDFDIMFDRPNYDRFIDLMKCKSQNMFFLERDQWVYRIRKEHKLKSYVPSIDLFVLDKIPANSLVYTGQKLMLRIMQGMLRENTTRRKYSLFYSFCIKFTELLGKIADPNSLFSNYDKLSRVGNLSDSNYLAIFNDKFKLIGLKYNLTLMESYSLHKFENKHFYVIDHYDEYLTRQFGNYMDFPPEEERVPIHLE